MTSTPTLSEQRIATMRDHVMQAVDADIQQRGSRGRRVAGLAAAAVVVIGIGTVGVQAVGSGMGSGGSDSADMAEAPSAARDTAGGAEKAPDIPNGSSVRGTTDAPVAPVDGDRAREVIVTGSVYVTVKDPRATAQQLSTYVDSIGGRVDSRSESGSGDSASAHVVVRVPSAKVTATIDRLEEFGTVDDVSLHNDDVTAQGRDLDARIRALEVSIARLEKILADADSSTEVIKAETALTQRQEQVEALQAQRQSLSDQVSLSSLEIELNQKPKPESVSSGGFTGGLLDGWNALVSTVNAIVTVVGALLPWAALVSLLYLVYRLVARRRSWN